MFEWKRHHIWAAVYEPLRPRDKGHSTETRAQMKRNQEKTYIHTKMTIGVFVKSMDGVR